MNKAYIYTILLLSLSLGALQAQVSVKTQLNKSKIIIGDQIKASVYISAPKGTTIESVRYQDWEEAGIELLDMSELLTSSRSPSLVMIQELKLTSFDTGYHRLPPLAVLYTQNGMLDTTYSNDLAIEVLGMEVQADAPIRGNKDIIKEKQNFRDYLPYLLGALSVLFIGGLLWWMKNKSEDKEEVIAPPPPPRPAHEIALEKLNLLKQNAAWQSGDIKAFQSDLTYAFREYLENRYSLHALEATTSEIQAQLSSIAIDKEAQKEMSSILQTADMVKFAKATPPLETHAQALDTIINFVENTKKVHTITDNKDTDL